MKFLTVTQDRLMLGVVNVMCHATWARMLVATPNLQRVRATVVMDESHFLETWSIVARGLMEKHFLEGRGSIYYLTATPPGTETIPGSNFAIQDLPLKMAFMLVLFSPEG